MQVRNWKHQFSFKVMVAIMIAVLIPTTLIGIFFYISSAGIIKENSRVFSLQITKQTADALSFILSAGSDTSDLLYSNESLQHIVTAGKQATESDHDQMNAFLNTQVYSSSFVRMIYVLQENGTSWGSGNFSHVKLKQYPVTEFVWSKEAIQKNGELAWQGLQYDVYSGVGEATQLVLPVIRIMKDFKTMDNIAYIQVNLDGQAILDKINQVKLGETGEFFVVDEAGHVMMSRDLDLVNKRLPNQQLSRYVQDKEISEFEFSSGPTPYYGVKQPLSNGWSVVGIVPVEEITGDLQNVQMITIGTSLLFTILAVIIGFFAANTVTKPIKTLTAQMKKVGYGDFHPVEHIASDDEIGLMSRQFNQMIEQVQELMEQVKEEETHKKEAELRAVKHRIDPHFLFNTLSTVKWLLKFKQTDRAEAALSALTRLLEANMGKKGNFISIKEELDIVEKFLVILQIRYEQEFSLQVQLDPEVEETFIPRMLIQPIVENAVFHGFVPRGSGGEITISGKKLKQGIKIEIRDNGIGFQTDTTDTAPSSTGIGLAHIYDSVRLYFHPDSSVAIESGNTGTTVTLTLFEKKGGEQNA